MPMVFDGLSVMNTNIKSEMFLDCLWDISNKGGKKTTKKSAAQA